MKCKIRPDLLAENLSTDVWKDFADGNPHMYLNSVEIFDCRWRNEHTDNEQFQIRWACSWWNANSIDFEFIS